MAPVVIVGLLALLRLASALQFTPNSPCASVCIDSQGLDKSDPGSSSTKGSDIVCTDAEFNTTSAGRKFRECQECLQTSRFSQGQENDQMWFLCTPSSSPPPAALRPPALPHTIKYALDYLVFC